MGRSEKPGDTHQRRIGFVFLICWKENHVGETGRGFWWLRFAAVQKGKVYKFVSSCITRDVASAARTARAGVPWVVESKLSA
jgi:hypothetical protein